MYCITKVSIQLIYRDMIQSPSQNVYCFLSEKTKYNLKRKTPSIRSKEITYRLCKGLKECLTTSQKLMSIELHGLPLRDRDIAALSKVSTTISTGNLEPSIIVKFFHKCTNLKGGGGKTDV